MAKKKAQIVVSPYEIRKIRTVSHLMENGSSIARLYTRWHGGSRTKGGIPETIFKFSTERGKARFADFCNSISMSEIAKALGYKHV